MQRNDSFDAIADALVERGLAAPDDLDTAKRTRSIQGGSVLVHLVAHGSIDPDALADFLGERFDLPVADDGLVESLERAAWEAVPFELMYEHGVLPVRRAESGSLVVAVVDPTAWGGLEETSYYAGTEFDLLVASVPLFARAFEQAFGQSWRVPSIELGRLGPPVPGRAGRAPSPTGRYTRVRGKVEAPAAARPGRASGPSTNKSTRVPDPAEPSLEIVPVHDTGDEPVIDLVPARPARTRTDSGVPKLATPPPVGARGRPEDTLAAAPSPGAIPPPEERRAPAPGPRESQPATESGDAPLSDEAVPGPLAPLSTVVAAMGEPDRTTTVAFDLLERGLGAARARDALARQIVETLHLVYPTVVLLSLRLPRVTVWDARLESGLDAPVGASFEVEGESVWQQVATSGVAFLGEIPPSDPVRRGLPRVFGPRSLAVPLRLGDRRIGVLVLDAGASGKLPAPGRQLEHLAGWVEQCLKRVIIRRKAGSPEP